MIGLGNLPESNFSEALDVSADGTVLVGYSILVRAIPQAFRWTKEGGMVALGELPGGHLDSRAYGVSANGSVVVGSSSGSSGNEAFVWTSGIGMIKLQDLLLSHGVSNLTGWELREAKSLSADGRTIVGYGENPDGNTEAWIATIPEPGTITLAATGLACACLIVTRRRNNRSA
jgi:probable HAF family extracellular repeat protein